MIKDSKINNWWKPSKVKFSPKQSSKVNPFWNTKPISKTKMTWFKDSDRDGVVNLFDCQPYNKKKQGWAHEGGMVYYPDQTTRVKMMTPDKFLRTTYNEYNRKRGKAGEEPMGYEGYIRGIINQERVEKLKPVLRSSKGKMHLPFLQYDSQGRSTSHEGRHRATAAKQLGVKLIPVSVSRLKKEYYSGEEQKEQKEIKTMKDLDAYNKKRVLRMEKEDREEEEHKINQSIASADIPIQKQREYGKPNTEGLQSLNKRYTQESDYNKERRIRHGATRIETVDAREFKRNWEEQHKEKLDWNKERLSQALERNEDDSYPEVSISEDKVDIADGRHRISAAAERNQVIDVAIEEDDEELIDKK